MSGERKSTFLLEDIVTCGTCGQRLVKEKTRYGIRYVCKRPECSETGIFPDELRKLALKYVEMACSEETQKAVQEAMEQSRLAANAELERPRAERQIGELEKQIGKLEERIREKREKMEALREVEERIAQRVYPDTNAYFKTWNDNRLAMDVNWKTREKVLRAYIQHIGVTRDALRFTSTFDQWVRQQKEGKTVIADGFEQKESAPKGAGRKK